MRHQLHDRALEGGARGRRLQQRQAHAHQPSPARALTGKDISMSAKDHGSFD